MRLSETVTESSAKELGDAIRSGRFPGVSLKQALEFLLSDGILPASGLPVQSFLDLEDWARGAARR